MNKIVILNALKTAKQLRSKSQPTGIALGLLPTLFLRENSAVIKALCFIACGFFTAFRMTAEFCHSEHREDREAATK
ncbi:hypothetical protein [Pedobacter chinensis]|uniref:hypothetical protein n=1 Tax=Pedobacter chinensis TaxID=2282421 RepID=UPI000E1BF46C|nr:hypothetical protein [Pedobacter chinensis]